MPGGKKNPFPNINLAADRGKTSLPELSYPIRSIHTPWVESSVPLVIKVRYSQWTLLQLSNFFFRSRNQKVFVTKLVLYTATGRRV